MKKETVEKFDLEAAFKALDEIEIPVAEKGIAANRVDLKERFSQKPAHETLVEDYYDVNNSESLEVAADEREGEVAQAKLARIEKIVDLDAESPEDLLPSYVGKVIMQCPQCMTLFYKNPEDIEHSEENPDVVNINEVCQHCGNTSGYTLIGKVDSVSEDEAANYEAAENGEENELDLDFDLEEEPAEEASTEEAPSEEELDLDLSLDEIPEETEEEKKEESLNLSKETSKNETEHKSENLTLNEESLSKEEKERFTDIDLDKLSQEEQEKIKDDAKKAEIGSKLSEHVEYNVYERTPTTRIIVNAGGNERYYETLEDAINDVEEWYMNCWDEEYAETLYSVLCDMRDEDEIMYDEDENGVRTYCREALKEAAVETKYFACYVDGGEKLVGYVKANDEQEAYMKMEKHWPEYPYSSYDGYAVVDEVTEEDAMADSSVKIIDEHLTEELDKELDKKLKIHNDYIEYLKKMIEQEEEALKKAEDNEEIKAAIQRRLDAFMADLDAALPEAIKNPETPVEEAPEDIEVAAEETVEEAPVEEVVEETPAEEVTETEAKEVEENLTEAGVKETETDQACAVVFGDNEDHQLFTGTKEQCEKIIEKNKDSQAAALHGGLKIKCPAKVPVADESLNNSEVQKDAAEHSALKTENGSENLSLNESLTEDIDDGLDSLLNSEEFKKPISEKEVQKYLGEDIDSTEELDEAGLFGKLKDKVKDIWDRHVSPTARHDKKTGNSLNKDFGTYVVVKWASMADEGVSTGNYETAIFREWDKAKRVAMEWASVSTNGPATIFGYKDDAAADVDIDGKAYLTVLKTTATGGTITGQYLGRWKYDGATKGPKMVDAITGKEHDESPADRLGQDIAHREKSETNTERDATVTAGQVTKAANSFEIRVGTMKWPEAGDWDSDFQKAVDKAKNIATASSAKSVSIWGESKADASKGLLRLVTYTDGKPSKDSNARLVNFVNGKLDGLTESFSITAFEDFDEAAFNAPVTKFLTETYSNVKDFKVTDCSMNEELVTITGVISFNSGNEKETVFEFTPSYCADNLVFSGCNKDFSDTNAFSLYCDAANPTNLVTENFEYRYTVNNTLVEGLN